MLSKIGQSYILYNKQAKDRMVVSLFVTPESGILVNDSFPLSAQYELLIGIEIPYYYFIAKVCLS